MVLNQNMMEKSVEKKADIMMREIMGDHSSNIELEDVKEALIDLITKIYVLEEDLYYANLN